MNAARQTLTNVVNRAIANGAPVFTEQAPPLLISRDNIDSLLDRHVIQLYSPHRGKWYDIRRNGATKRWKRDARRIAIPCKVGFRECFTITESDFSHNGWHVAANYLEPTEYRVKPI